jgi:NAD(P)-dependent dehydrogenase (short-subunit alcohol dehydrogenase family)
MSRVAVVTGSGRGLGRAIADALAETGHTLVIAEINPELAEQAAAGLREAGHRAMAVSCDVARKNSVEKLAAAVLEQYGRVDVLVNNAAVIAPAPALEMSEDEWDRVLDVGLKGVFLCSQALGRIMVAQKSGSVINIASVAAERGNPGRANYCAAKAGVVALTRVLAMEWAADGIRVNAVGPGYVNTELQQEALAQGINSLERLVAAIPAGRLAEPSEIARMVAFLASEAAGYITGQTFFVDGGWLAAPPR